MIDQSGEPKQQVRIQVHGQEVVGEIYYRSSRDIAVRILAPYVGLVSDRHIPYFAAGHATYLGERGDGEAQWLLKECFELGLYLDQHLEQLKAAWAMHLKETSDSVRGGVDGHVALVSQRKALRASLRMGELSPVQYQADLAKARRIQQDAESHQFHAIWAFMTENFPDSLVNVELEGQVIPILEGRVQLRP
jgi:hypothetical protein